jgi:hypothetical protein
MNLTNEQKQQIIDAAATEIRERATKQAVDSLARWTSSAVSGVIDDEVRALVRVLAAWGRRHKGPDDAATRRQALGDPK